MRLNLILSILRMMFLCRRKCKNSFIEWNFESDKVSYDRKNKIFKVHSTFTFKSGEQFLDGDYLEYDFSKSEGFIEIYGQLNLKTISEDLSSNNNLFEDEICPSKEINTLIYHQKLNY